MLESVAFSRVVLGLYCAVMVLLPFSRLAELPLLLLALLGAFALFKKWQVLRSLAAFAVLNAVFFSYFFMVLLSATDSYWQDKTLLVALASVRFYLASVALLCFLQTRHFALFYRWVMLLVVFWAMDALLQYFVGVDLFARSSYAGRLNGVFGQHHVKLGPVLALLLPLVLIGLQKTYAWFRWLSLFVVVICILLSGTRSAWLMMGFTLLAYWWHHVRHRRLQLLFKAVLASVLMVVSLWFIAPEFQQRIERSMAVFQGTQQALDFALADRLPIWYSAWEMFTHHPINGIGAHGFRKAYAEFSAADDVWQRQGGVGMHAHHWLLEILAETGLIGLLLFVFAALRLLRFVRHNFHKQYSWAFVVALLSAFLPITSIYSLFASFWSICIWFVGAGLIVMSRENAE